jgi:hypothetical protein
MIGARDLFAKPDPQPTTGAIIRWWEARRLHYNVITLAWGFLWVLISYLRGNHMWLATPLAIPTYILSVQLPANIWYTGGWIADLIGKKVLHIPWRGFGPWALALGIAFSFLFILVVVFL